MGRRRPITGPENPISGPPTNSIVELVLPFSTNLFLGDDIPIDLLTLVVCAIGEGWSLIPILQLLGVAY